MPVVIAKQEFQGNPQEQELSFPVGAIIEVTPEGSYAPRTDGWRQGKYNHEIGWFPVSHVEDMSVYQPLDDSQISPLIQQGYTEGMNVVSC